MHIFSKSWQLRTRNAPCLASFRAFSINLMALIKAGRITDEQFYAWSEKAREEKKKCDREIISLEEFQQWLRDSKT